MTETFPIINMTRWSLITITGEAHLTGIADNHPKLGKNAYVWFTSPIQKVLSTDNDIITVKTHNSIYVCPLKYMNDDFKTYDAECIREIHPELYGLIDLVNSIADGSASEEGSGRLIRLIKQGKLELLALENKNNTELLSKVANKEDTIYIEVSCIATGDNLAYHIGDKTGVIKPRLHAGMFHDSILYTEYDLVDFRYFPEGDRMRIYCWSDSIKHLLVKNLKGYSIKVNNQNINPDETVEVSKDNYNCELFSPNCVDGSSLLQE